MMFKKKVIKLIIGLTQHLFYEEIKGLKKIAGVVPGFEVGLEIGDWIPRMIYGSEEECVLTKEGRHVPDAGGSDLGVWRVLAHAAGHGAELK